MSKARQIAAADKLDQASSGKVWIKLVAVVGATATVLFIPPQHGLSPEGQRVLAVVVASVLLWATEILPVAVSSLLAIVLLSVSGGAKTPSDAMVGFSSPILYFLLGSQVMGAAVMKSGLAERLAGYLVDRSGGSPGKLVAQLLISMPPMAFLIPSAINRNTMLIPCYEQVFRSLSIAKGDRLARMVMLTLGLLNPLASSAFMTGGLAPMTTSTLLGGFTWFRWFALMAAPYYLLIALGGALIYLLFKPKDRPAVDRFSIATHRKPLSRDERTTLAIIVGTTLLWLTDFLHHWNSAIPALIAGIALMSPRIGLFSWSQFEKMVSWSNFFFLGTSLSLTQALISTGAASWFAQLLLGMLNGSTLSPATLAIFIILVTSAVHLAIPNQAACISLLIPVITAFANATGISPVAAGLIVGIVVDTVILYQVETVTILLTYETGHFSTSDVTKVGMGMLALTIAVVLLVAIPWWSLLGLSFS